MAYQEVVTPATPAAVIDAIRAFAEANGWTVLRNNLVGNNRTVTLKRPETDHIHIYNLDLNKIYLRMSIAYAAGTAPDAMADRSQRAHVSCMAGPYTKLFLFADTSPSAYVHAILESNNAGEYYHMSLGMVDKLDAWTGGTYVDGTYWYNQNSPSMPVHWYSGSYTHALFGNDWGGNTTPLNSGTSTQYVFGGMRVDIPADARVNAWAGFAAVPPTSITNTVAGYPVYSGISPSGQNPVGGQLPPYISTGIVDSHLSIFAKAVDDNAFSNRSVFHPIEFTVGRVGGYASPIGRAPGIRFCSIQKFTNGQEITIGSDVWKVFPMLKRGMGAGAGTALTPYLNGSVDLGYAYLKTA